MTDTNSSNPSRRDAMQQLAAGASLVAIPAQAQTSPLSTNQASTPQDFVRLQKQLSNWGRWGADDQMGAVNLITPAKRKAAYEKAMAQIDADRPLIYIYHQAYIFAYSAKLEGYAQRPDGIVRIQDIKIAK